MATKVEDTIKNSTIYITWKGKTYLCRDYFEMTLQLLCHGFSFRRVEKQGILKHNRLKLANA
jgi:hypothetical protein